VAKNTALIVELFALSTLRMARRQFMKGSLRIDW